MPELCYETRCTPTENLPLLHQEAVLGETSNMVIRSPFSYYGSKSKIAHLYPPPEHNLIVEPFAGGAAYGWLHRRDSLGNKLDVWLNDLDSKTFSIWKFLTSPDACAIVEAYVPDKVEMGQKVSEIIPECFSGLVELCRAEANQGTQGTKSVRDQITFMGAKCWKVKRKLLEVIPEVSEWKITNVDYKQLANVEATWFIDPPYIGAGKVYRMGSDLINYEELGWWVLGRRGMSITCENYPADWLPFEKMEHPRVSIRSRYQKANAPEAVYIHRSELIDPSI